MRIRLLGAERSIRVKLLVTYVFFVLPLAFFGLLWTARLIEDERRLVLAATEGKADHTSYHVTSFVDSVEATLKAAAEIPAVRELNGDASPILASLLASNPMLTNLFVLTKEGERVATADPSSQVRASASDLDYFNAAIRTGRTAVGNAAIAADGMARGYPVIHVATPIKDPTGMQVGVVAASVSLEDLRKLVAVKKENSGSYVYAVDRRGKAIIHPDVEFVKSLKDLASLPPVAAAVGGGQGVTEFADPIEGQGYLAFYRPIPSTPWGAVAVYPLVRLEVAKRDSLIAGVSAIAFSSALALLIATLVAKPIATSIRELAAATRAVASGKLGVVVDINRRDEIGELAQTFNVMSRDLAGVVERLRAARRQLDEAYQEIGEALISGNDLSLTLQVAMRSAVEQLDMESAAVGLLDEDGNRLQWTTAVGCPSGVVIDSTEDVAETDVSVRQAIASQGPSILERQEVTAEDEGWAGPTLALPLTARGRCLGVLVLYGGRGRLPLSDEEITGIQTLANHLAVGVDNARSHAKIERLVEDLETSFEQLAAQNEELQAQNEEIHSQSEELQAQDEELRIAIAELHAKNDELERQQTETQHHVERLTALSEVSKSVSSSLDLKEVCQQAVESTAKVIGSKVAALYVANWQEKTLKLQAVVGAPEEYRRDYAVLPINDQILSGRAALTGEPQISGVVTPPPMTRKVNVLLQVTNFIMIPILCKGHVVGVMNLSGPHDRPAKSQEIELLMTIANQIGVAIENSALYNQAKEVDRLKDEFISIASHELRSPLTSIKGYAQLLLRRAQLTSTTDLDLRGLQVINEQIDRMTRLVNELLDVSRIEGGRLLLHFQPVSLARLLEKVVDNVQITTDRHKLHLELPQLEVAGGWDELRIEEVLQNLLSNAVKYSPRGGGIWIKAAVVPGTVEISVQDEGIGIPREGLPHVFERFYQATNVDRSNYGGLGLSLYVSHQIVLLHGGRMWVESEDGKGSRFFFTLPIA